MGICACCDYEGDQPVGDLWLCLGCFISWNASAAKAAAKSQDDIEKLKQFVEGWCCSHRSFYVNYPGYPGVQEV
jgi:hypothetical protein